MGDSQTVFFERMIINIMIPEERCRNDKYDAQCVTSREYETALGDYLVSIITNENRFD